MRTDHLRAHADYCQARVRTAPDDASRRRWESECADWLSLERELARARTGDLEPRAVDEPRSFGLRAG